MYNIYPCDITSTGECPYVIPHCSTCKDDSDTKYIYDTEEDTTDDDCQHDS